MVTLTLAATAGHGATTDRAGDVSDADAASFHAVRPRLFGIAYRVLGSATEADDVVQDTWIRWQRTDRSEVRDAAGFLATTTARLAINVRQSARARHETSIGRLPVEPVDSGADPWLGAEQREALELAVRTLLEKLSPSERAVYVLREAFDYPYRQVAEILALSEVNARQLAARARRRVSGEHRRPIRAHEQQRLLDAFIAATQTGAIASLEQLLAAPTHGRVTTRASARSSLVHDRTPPADATRPTRAKGTTCSARL